MRVFDETQTLADLDFPGLIDALYTAHQGDAALVERSLLNEPGGNGFLVQPAWLPGRALGVKMATLFPANPCRGLPTVQAVYQLFDGIDGRPLAVMDGTVLTWRKTAADSALGSRLLSRPDARTLLLVGAGALGPHMIEAHRVVRPELERVLVWNRGTERRNALVDAVREEGIDAQPVDDLDAAVAQADIICTITASERPLIRGTLLQPGSHLDLVGSYTPRMRESDDDCIRRGQVYVDLPLTTVEAAGDLTQPMAAGVVDRDHILGDLYDLCSGRVPGRRSPKDVTVFKNGGGGHLDLYTAMYLARMTS
jgi:ornithine cyclodeaminase/alanine dehydrogenase-like protein (mu-crystallin family)